MVLSPTAGRQHPWCGAGSDDPPLRISHTPAHPRTHLQARRTLGSCGTSKALEKSNKTRGQGQSYPSRLGESHRRGQAHQWGPTPSPPHQAVLSCDSPGHRAAQGLHGHPVGERRSPMGESQCQPTKETQEVHPLSDGVGWGQEQGRMQGYLPLGQGSPSDLANPG